MNILYTKQNFYVKKSGVPYSLLSYKTFISCISSIKLNKQLSATLKTNTLHSDLDKQTKTIYSVYNVAYKN